MQNDGEPRQCKMTVANDHEEHEGDEMRADVGLNRKFATLGLPVGLVCAPQAADRAEITFSDGRIFPESLTSTKNGAVYFGSLGQDSVYRATPTSSRAEKWIQPKSNGLL